MTDIIVRRYQARAPIEWGDPAEAQTRMRAMWNRLVELEHGHRTAYDALTADDGADTAERLALATAALRCDLQDAVSL